MIKKEIEGAALLSIYNELKDEIKAIRTDIQNLNIQQPQQSENNQELNSLLKETIVNAVNDTINAHINSRENYADEVSRRCKNTIDFAIERETKLVNNVLLPKLSPIIQIDKKVDAIHCITSTIPVIENNQKNPIRCLFDADEMRVSTVSGLGRVVNYTHANVSGDRVEIGFNSKYVLDALNAADTDQVRIELSGPVSPVKVLPMTDDSFLFLVLPMRLKNEA